MKRRVLNGVTWFQRRKKLVERLEYMRTMQLVERQILELGEQEQFFLALEILKGDLQNDDNSKKKKEDRAKRKKGG